MFHLLNTNDYASLVDHSAAAHFLRAAAQTPLRQAQGLFSLQSNSKKITSMKIISLHLLRVGCIVCTSLLLLEARSQSTVIHQLHVTDNKTSSLVFEANIDHVDLGSPDVLAQSIKGIDNVLKVKAARRAKFPETNITVITKDGVMHSFKVNYAEVIENTTVEVGRGEHHSVPLPIHFSTQLTSSFKEAAVKSILTEKPFLRMSDKSGKVSLQLKGIFIQDKTMFYRLELTNASPIRYDIANLRWYIKDKKQIKRTAIQEVPLHPVFVHGLDSAVVKGHHSQEIIFAFDKFTLPDSKKVIIEVMEEKGGRHLELSVKSKMIVRAHPLDFKQ